MPIGDAGQRATDANAAAAAAKRRAAQQAAAAKKKQQAAAAKKKQQQQAAAAKKLGIGELPGTFNPATGKVVMPADQFKPPKPAERRRNAEILRRQRMLRQAGYNVALDGQWGPRSQQMWNKYLKTRSVVFKKDPNDTRDLTNPVESVGYFSTDPGETPAEKAARVRAEKRIAQEKARRQAEIDRKLAKKAVLNRAAILRKNPMAARKMSLRELTDVLVDKEAKFDPTKSAAAARAIQWHLKAKGFKVEVNGVFDKKTYEALQSAFKRQERIEKRKQFALMKEKFYDSGVIKPGTTPGWWKFGPMPTPEKLLQTLQAGGFQADMMWRALVQHAESDPMVWERVKKAQLAEIVETNYAASPSAMLAKVFGSDAVPVYQYYADILAIQDVMPFGDYARAGFTEEEKLKHLSARAKNKEVILRNFRQIDAMRLQVKTLVNSTSAEDFNNVWAAMAKVQDMRFRRAQQEMAAEKSSWWGEAIDAVLAPGEFMRTALTYDVMLASSLVFGKSAGQRELRWEDARLALESANPVLSFGLELTADPLNVAHPFKWLSAAGSLSARAAGKTATLGTYHLTGEGLRKSLVYSKGTWSKKEVAERLLAIDDPLGVLDTEFGQAYRNRVAENMRRLGQTKDEALGKVSMRLKQAATHGYVQSKHAVDYKVPVVKDKVAKDALELSAVNVARTVMTLPALRPLLKELRRGNLSLWTDASRTNLSVYGASVRAFVTSNMNAMVSAQLAADVAKSKYDDAFEMAVMRGMDEAAAREVAQAEMHAEYQRILGSFGSFLKGGASKEITELDRELRTRLKFAREKLNKVILPTIQTELEREADAAFDGLKAQRATGEVAPKMKPDAPMESQSAALGVHRYAGGKPGYSVERSNGRISAVYRDAQGEAKAYAMVEGGQPVVYTSPELRRQGIATKLYKELEGAGVNIEAISGTGELSGAGSAFFSGRRAKQAIEDLQHPLFNEQGVWHGAAATADSDLLATIRKSFGEDALVDMPNPRFGVSHNAVEMAEVIQEEIGVGMWRLDDYLARNKAAGTLPDTFDYDRAAAKVEDDAKNAWVKGDDGLYHDTRELIPTSSLYVRQMEQFASKPLVVKNGELDMMASLGEFSTMSQYGGVDEGLYNLSLMLSHARQKALPGGASTPGMSGSLPEQEKILSAALDERLHAIKLAEDSVLSSELWRERALWRAWQETQSAPLKYAYKAINSQLQIWKFLTLALRPGWVVRNVVDNTAKLLIAGARDPRLFFAGAGSKLKSVFELGIMEIRYAVAFCDEMFHTNVGKYFDSLLDHFWSLPPDALQGVFRSHNIPVPAVVFEGSFSRSLWDESLGLQRTAAIDESRLVELGLVDAPSQARVVAREVSGSIVGRSREIQRALFGLMGEMPENHAKSVLYRSSYSKRMDELADSGMSSVDRELEAFAAGLKAVEDTLFDYSKISVAEDNFQVFFPFIQFWRKNTTFWVKSFASKPWLNNAVLQFDDNRRDEWHLDQPVWMRRYLHTDELADALAVVPGLDGAMDMLGLSDGAAFDPLSFSSMSPLYRAFKGAAYGDSQMLPADEKGHRIFGPIFDALNEWGLGVSPFVRKPLEGAGLANRRAWQRVFPQTAMAEVIGQRMGWEWLGKLGMSMERILAFGPLGIKFETVDPEAIADQFDYWVQTAIAEQVARGEKPDLKKAEETIKDWFFVQQMWAYYGGVYLRRQTPEDMYMAKLADDVLTGEVERLADLTDKDKELLKLWSMRGMDRMTYNRYIELYPVIKAYYQGDFDDKNQIVKDNPEILRWVDGDYNGRPLSKRFVRDAARYHDQEAFFDALEIADTLDLPHELKEAANDIFGSEEINKYWKKNSTGKRLRERMIAGEAHDYYRKLNQAYFSIPSDDFGARDSFVADHPELIRYWNRNNDPTDDYEAIMGSAKASLRSTYFAMVKKGGWDGGAAEFLKDFSFMFEGTKAEDKLKNGEWIPSGGGNGKWSAERLHAFLAAKPHLNWFFKTFMPKVGKQKAWAWLDESDTEAAKLIKGYLDKWSKGGQKRLDWLEASPYLKIYFGMPKDERGEWLRGGSEGAKLVLAFFKKYGSEKGLTQHAKDFLDTKEELKYYGSLSKEERNAWLESDDPRAKKVLAYFKKYGKGHQFERSFKKLVAKYPGLANGTPEQAKRIAFWREYFSLTPDKRPAFAMEHAEESGVFVYGEFGEEESHDREQEYIRRAVGISLSEKQAAYLYVKPLLDFYRTLPKSQRPLFLRANPELQRYFDNHSKKSLTGNKKLDALVEAYFDLPPDSTARSRFLSKHPGVQDWFDKKNPAGAAMRNLLEQYFNIEYADEKREFLLEHPEIQAYFDAREAERRQTDEALHAFDRSDPRLRPFFEDAKDLERSAALMRHKLRQSMVNRLSPDNIEVNRERKAYAA